MLKNLINAADLFEEIIRLQWQNGLDKYEQDAILQKRAEAREILIPLYRLIEIEADLRKHKHEKDKQ